MRFLWIILVVLIIGCASKPPLTMYKNDEQMILKDAFVDLPMPFIYPSMENQNYIRCFEEQFCSLFPVMKDMDFKDGRYWSVMTSNNSYSIYTAEKTPINKQQAVNNYVNYSIHLSTYISPYSQVDRALERGDVEFISKKYKQGTEENGRIYWINTHIEEHGKEKYKCLVYEDYKPANKSLKVDTRTKTIACSKFNPQRTMTKEVAITLIYTLASDMPKELEYLKKDYTYEDLQERAKRMLDSLYIKDGWDE